METILRKIKTSDKLPDNDKWYFVHHSIKAPVDGMSDFLKWISETQKWYGIKLQDVFETYDIEYWYEEVDLNKIIQLEKQKYLTELTERFKEILPNDLHLYLAKERYNNSLKLFETIVVNNVDYNKKLIIKALKVAAGLNEEEI